VLITK